MIKLPTILSQSKKQQRAEQRTQLHNNTLKRIVDELAIIRSIKQKPIDDKEVVSKQPLSVVSRKVKQFVGSVTKRDKPATAVESKKEPTKLSGPSTGLVGFAGAAGAIGLLATISPFFKGFITEILKQTFNLVTGIMPQPVQDLVKMFTSGENGPIEQSQRIQSELQSVEQDFGSDPIPKQAQTQRQIESGQRNLERETRRATNELESAQQPSQPQAPTPAPSTPAPAPTAAPTPSATQAAAPRQSALATPVAKPSPAPTTQQATTRQNLTGVQSIIVTALNENGITSPRAHANILATVKAESDFIPRSENLTYESGERIQAVFGKRRFPTLEFANKFVGKPEALANEAYKSTDGNSEPGDGYKYRGRGFIQHTGKNQYAALSRFTGIDLINNPDALNEPSIAAKAIAWFFLSYKRLKPADLENMSTVNRAIGFADPNRTKAAARIELAENIFSSINQPSQSAQVASAPSTGAAVATASADVVSARKQEQAQSRVQQNNVLIARSQTTAIL